VKDCIVSFRFSGESYAAMKAAAGADGITVSAWVRRCVTRDLIPGPVAEQLKAAFRPDITDVVSRPSPLFGGKSPLRYVAEGDGTWDDVLAKYKAMLSWQVTA